MSEGRRAWWSKAIMVGAVIALVCLPLGALGYRFGVIDLGSGIALTVVGTALAALCLVLGIIALIVVLAKGRVADRGSVVVGLLISGVIVALMAPHLGSAGSVPQIHNISTDTADPPQFDQIVALRGEGTNPLEYDAEKLAPLQTKAYPQVTTLQSDLSAGELLNKAEAALADMGLEIVNVDQGARIIEATATTFWFGFKDDVVVRVREQDGGAILDARSVSRVGLSDLGVNAARITELLQRLQ